MVNFHNCKLQSINGYVFEFLFDGNLLFIPVNNGISVFNLRLKKVESHFENEENTSVCSIQGLPLEFGYLLVSLGVNGLLNFQVYQTCENNRIN